MRVLFCADPLTPGQPDSAFQQDAAAVSTLSLGCDLIDFETLVYEGDATRAVRHVPDQEHAVWGLYRGWMMPPDVYFRFFEALAVRGVILFNTPAEYQHCHLLPESYSVIQPHTANTVWMSTGPEIDFDAVMDLLMPFDACPVIVKDYVKSQKDIWEEACYIPDASSRADVERVVRRFVELQGSDFYGGLVFREFVSLDLLPGAPRAREFRTFFLDGKPVYSVENWDGGSRIKSTSFSDAISTTAKEIDSRFFSMDVARRADGDWMIVEVGDAQVAGLPDSADRIAFYDVLRNRDLHN